MDRNRRDRHARAAEARRPVLREDHGHGEEDFEVREGDDNEGGSPGSSIYYSDGGTALSGPEDIADRPEIGEVFRDRHGRAYGMHPPGQTRDRRHRLRLLSPAKSSDFYRHGRALGKAHLPRDGGGRRHHSGDDYDPWYNKPRAMHPRGPQRQPTPRNNNGHLVSAPGRPPRSYPSHQHVWDDYIPRGAWAHPRVPLIEPFYTESFILSERVRWSNEQPLRVRKKRKLCPLSVA